MRGVCPQFSYSDAFHREICWGMGMVGYRITARSLDSRYVGDRVLKEIADLEECATLSDTEVVPRPVSGRVVFVLEEDDDALPRARGPLTK